MKEKLKDLTYDELLELLNKIEEHITYLQDNIVKEGESNEN